MRCRICGAELPDGAMFCGECGSSTSATPESRRRDPRPGDTMILDRAALSTGVVSVPVDGFQPIVGEPDDARPTSGSRAPDATDAPDAPVAADAEGHRAAGAGAAGAGRVATVPDPATFTLRFSTGETCTVSGTGLIGRRPMPQPGERFDHLVQVADRTLSMSKTHLEFGSHDGLLWISDRFSGNGTIVRRPDDGALRCEPGRRYLVPRGSVVQVADQSFVVG